FGHPHGWLILLALMGLGAWTRHFFNLRNQGRVVWAIPTSAALGVVLLAVLIAPRPTNQTQPVAFAQADVVVKQRCVPCHSATPTQPGFTTAPNGAMFDTPAEIKARAPLIYQRAVVTKDMPLGNLTGITQQERDALGAWIEQGAQTP